MTKSPQHQLSQEIIKPVKIREIVVSLLSTFAIVSLVNWATIWYLENYPRHVSYSRIKDKWELLLDLEEPVDWLILGDSSCHQGVNPKIIESQLKESVLNLCTFADSLALNNVWMLDYYIKKHGVPKNVILVHVYDVWHRELNANVIAPIPFRSKFWQEMEPKIELTEEEELQIFLSRYFPLYAKDYSIKNLLKNPTSFLQNPKGEPVEFATASEADVQRVEENSADHIRFVQENEPELSRENRLALEHLIKLTKSHKFNLYLVNSPIYEQLYKQKDLLEYYQQVQGTLSNFASQSERIHYLREPMLFPQEQLENSDHLIESGAQIYTQELIRKISDYQNHN